jgi:hypothetical protein
MRAPSPACGGGSVYSLVDTISHFMRHWKQVQSTPNTPAMNYAICSTANVGVPVKSLS